MTATPDPLETIHIDDLGAFHQLLSYWHRNKVRVLEHLLELPQGFEVELDGKPSIALSGERHEGFLVGLTLALIELGTLPFVAETGCDARAEAPGAGLGGPPNAPPNAPPNGPTNGVTAEAANDAALVGAG